MIGRAYDVHAVEARWQAEWQRTGCHRAPQVPTGEKCFVHDATPFPNGPLHLGHVRTFVLGDVIARFERLRGKCVLYHTGFDSFGLAIELAARERGIAPQALVRRAIAEQKRQLARLGISHDPDRLADTSDPAVYRFTQWLFLEMLRAGIVERREAPVTWCPQCETTLARIQVEDGGCWRCGTPVATRRLPQWFVALSRYVPRLRETLDGRTGWSAHARRGVRALLDDTAGDGGARGRGGGDWLVSRQRSWGTPIPIVHCARCGVVPVPESDLPVRLPAGLDWSAGSGALARHAAFVHTACPACGLSARRETDTLDCGFDDQWCYFQTLVLHAASPGFTRENLTPWLPVDRSQSGCDTFAWFHLYRFFGAFLHERGLLDEADFIHGFFGHDMVLAGGKKMSKHLGNAVGPEAILDSDGADALRVAMLWAAGPQRPVHWEPERLDRSTRFLDAVHVLCRRVAHAPLRPAAPGGSGSQRARALAAEVARSIERVGRFIEEYRPNAGVEELVNLLARIAAFATPRIERSRLDAADGAILHGVLDDFTIALAPFAPHLAEEVRYLRGRAPLHARPG